MGPEIDYCSATLAGTDLDAPPPLADLRAFRHSLSAMATLSFYAVSSTLFRSLRASAI